VRAALDAARARARTADRTEPQPTLAVTGSLSAFLWLRVARSLGAQPSPLRYTRLGLLVVPVSVAAALAALRL